MQWVLKWSGGLSLGWFASTIILKSWTRKRDDGKSVTEIDLPGSIMQETCRGRRNVLFHLGYFSLRDGDNNIFLLSKIKSGPPPMLMGKRHENERFEGKEETS